MPIYEYLCQSCAHRFEVKQKFSDPPVERCVRCGKAVNRVISPPAIQFKGSGWYVTDYSNKLKAPSEAGNGQAKSDGQAQHDQKGQKEAPAVGSAPSSSAASTSSTETTSSTPSSGSASPATPSKSTDSGSTS